MSWLFSLALVEEYSPAECWDGEPYAQLNVMPTAHPFWRRGKTMDVLSLSPSGLTCAVLTEDRGEALLMSFLEASLVRTSALQEKEPASKASVQGSGRSSLESLAKYDQATSGWKTVHSSLLADSVSFSGIWPKWGSMRNGECWEASALDFPMSARECGFSLPTPSGVNGGRNHTMGRIDEWGGSSNPFRGTAIGSICCPEFEEMVMGWPLGWTEPMPFEMARFREWLREHSESYTPDFKEKAA